MRLHRYLGALAAALLVSCGSYGAPDEVLYGVAVYTQARTGFDPASIGTSYFLDTAMKVKNDLVETDETMPAGVENAIVANMTALGYTRVNTGDPLADILTAKARGGVGLKMAVLKGTAAVYYPGYWCDYWYYYSCYYDYYYAGSYSYGSVILEMGNLANYTPPPATPPGALQIEWGSLLYGVATTGTYDVSRAVEGVNRAFAQSPYLKRP